MYTKHTYPKWKKVNGQIAMLTFLVGMWYINLFSSNQKHKKWKGFFDKKHIRYTHIIEKAPNMIFFIILFG